MTSARPILWSFRRCPYAIRARLAVRAAGIEVELREIVLRDKPAAFLAASPSATVPALQLPDQGIDESLDIMIWALKQNDPQGLLQMPPEGWELIAQNDGPFKSALDHTKYSTRFPELDREVERAKAGEFLKALDRRLRDHAKSWLFADQATLADYAILPFIRQFANSDRGWFDSQNWPHLISWLDRFTESAVFNAVMTKYPTWGVGDPLIVFGPASESG